MISQVVVPTVRGAVASSRRVAVPQRHLSFACAQSVQRLSSILEEWRVKNYSGEFPKRFRKEVVKVATANSRRSLVAPAAASSAVCAEGIEHLLRNIGMADRMSRSEIEGIMSEFGEAPLGGGEEDAVGCVVSADRMLDLISKNWEDHHQGLNDV
ncbi:hypothetical protein ACHAWF_004800 [Thalassiosira exigua]